MNNTAEPTKDDPRDDAQDRLTQWHQAFYQALQLELIPWLDLLTFVYDYSLALDPLRIDVLIIRKAEGVTIEKNIARIFRSLNLVEYKSPGDYLSIDDFYKVLGYAFLLISLEKERQIKEKAKAHPGSPVVDVTGMTIDDITVTFVESRYPKRLIDHLTKERGYQVEESSPPGIYTVTGLPLPVQIVNSRQLSEEENLWLKDLDSGLDKERILRLTDAVKRLPKGALVGAYLRSIITPTCTRWRKL